MLRFNAWNTFVVWVEHPYIVRKSEKPLDIWVSPPSIPRNCSRKPKYMFSFSVANYSLKLHKKQSIKAAAHRIRCRAASSHAFCVRHTHLYTISLSHAL